MMSAFHAKATRTADAVLCRLRAKEGERARRESAEAHEKTLRAQISKEARIQQDLKRERDQALTEASEFKATVEERDKGLQSQIAKQADIEQGLKTERDRAVAEVGKLKTTIEGLTRSRPNPEAHSTSQPVKRWLSPVAVGALLLAAVLGGTLVSVWRSPDSGVERWPDQGKAALAASAAARQTAEAQAADADKARETAEAKSASASAALTRSEQARQAAEAKAADADKARQAAAGRADDADKARKAAEAKAADAEKLRQAALAKADDADKARLAAEVKLAQAIVPKPVATGTSGLFTLSSNMQVSSHYLPDKIVDATYFNCERICARSDACKSYTYSKKSRRCFMYSSILDLSPNEDFNSGIRNQQ